MSAPNGKHIRYPMENTFGTQWKTQLKARPSAGPHLYNNQTGPCGLQQRSLLLLRSFWDTSHTAES